MSRTNLRNCMSRPRLLWLAAGLAIVLIALAQPPAGAQSGVIFLAHLGAIMLLWALSTAVVLAQILAQILALLLLLFAPAALALLFLNHRRYSELGMFVVLAAFVVGWLVFSPDSVAGAARDIAKQIFG